MIPRRGTRGYQEPAQGSGDVHVYKTDQLHNNDHGHSRTVNIPRRGGPWIDATRYLDHPEASRAAIDRRFAELERIARARGAAVGVGQPYPVTLERLAAWARTLPEKNMVIAPLSALVPAQRPAQ